MANKKPIVQGPSQFQQLQAGDLLDASITGNAGTATKLATARAINGTNFDGSAAITTANWGTARTITIGSAGKSVNGSANVSWSLAEIGAQAALGFTPVQQGGGAGQGTNKTYIGWLGSNLGLQIDTTDFGANWPINVTGTAAGSVTNGSGVATITKLTAAAYAALGTKDASTLYVIVG